MSEKFTEAELDDLTDEEREALLSNDDVLEDDGQDEDDADAAESKAADGEQEGDDEPEAQDAAGDDSSAGADDAAEDEPEDQQAGQQRQYSPQLRAELPEDFDDRIKGIDDQRAELRKKYNEGDIDFDEYESQRDTLDEQRRQLEQQQFKANIAQELREDRWVNHDVAGFLAEHPEYKQGSALHTMLDQEVRVLQARAQNEGNDPLDPAILQAAHRSIREQLAKDLGLQVDTKPAGKRQGIPPKRDVPPTLGSVPAADIEDTDGGKWAVLDRLADSDPAAFQERLESMSDAERDAYLDAR